MNQALLKRIRTKCILQIVTLWKIHAFDLLQSYLDTCTVDFYWFALPNLLFGLLFRT